ncbi:hypothetical protein PHJA_000483100 [Phtheirospermum japonicum]|uniref:MHD1 domain-containing protein n=1 Tax=Phtheirospermum japonicum TaxID=374723 RepID=A0A830B8I4_9LAMI|nr:hypothetical protein PHJA_000483100 [Phtheirospermum japonicum]
MAHHHHHHLRISNTNHDVVHSHRPDPAHPPPSSDLASPFGQLDGLAREDFREAAYEVFFTACRSSPGFGGRSVINYYSSSASDDQLGPGDGMGSGFGSGPRSPGVGMAVTSRVKRSLGLKMIRRPPPSRRYSSCGGSNSPSSPVGGSSSPKAGLTVPGAGRMRRPLTSAEIMRQQMKVTEQSDNRLRKTLMRTLVGQMGRRAETIILPLELLRHLKPSEFNDTLEYHIWQKRQLRILETGLLLHPSIPLEKSDPSAAKLREIIQFCETKPIDTGKNSESMRALCNAVVSLAWRSPDNGTTDVCHWADGYPLNAEIYVSLLNSVFDSKDETQVLDEVDELLELMKKTWSMLGINRSIHNLCFAWVLFAQYVVTGQVEPDLLGAASNMLCEVANDAKKADREPIYVKMLGCVLAAMKRWCEKRLLDYYGNFDRGNVGVMEHILPLVFSCAKILQDDVPCYVASPHANVGEGYGDDLSGNRVDYYIRSSLRNAFAKMLEDQNVKGTESNETQRVSEVLIKLARETEELASKEKDIFSPVLKKWHPVAAGVAAVTLHSCYGTLLKQYFTGISSSLMNETISVLQRAGKLEKVLVQMVVEDSEECEDGGKSVVREMMPYEVDTLILNLLKQWIQERLMKGKEYLLRAKETETWNPKSKTEPYAHSASEIVKFAKEAVENFFEIPVNVSENLVYDLTDGLEHLFGDYITFVASCGSKQSYIPTLPPLTRCGRDSKFFKLWKRAACSAGTIDPDHQFFINTTETKLPPPLHQPRHPTPLHPPQHPSTTSSPSSTPSTKTLSLSPKITPPKSRFGNRRQLGSSYFEHSRSSIRTAFQHVSEVAAYRLIFLDSNSVFYGSLYVADVSTSRIKRALKTLKQNFTLLRGHRDRPSPAARPKRSDQGLVRGLPDGRTTGMIEEDFEEPEAGVVRLRGRADRGGRGGEGERDGGRGGGLVEDFSIVACEASGIGVVGIGKKLPMPPTTGRWNRSDPNTILRVLCHRDDAAANHFLKRTFHLPKRSGSG